MLNSLGLILGMIGVAMIFVWGPPQPRMEEGVSIGLEDDNELTGGMTVREHDERVRRTRSKHHNLSRSGLVFIGLGFVFQLVATLLG